MTLSVAEASDPKKNPLNPEGIKPCCACPQTKKARDECFLFNGSNADSSNGSSDACKGVLEAHQACMRSFGFPV
ncbi:hypothetical protein E3P81_02015 [Wallemia ichthyophaga]|nr:hypothetical protein E3P97_02014 [Wallemia ichthyophaga]TIB06475.1 hypothetical protein E3P96_00390 [Wallemia ichthyophaga]TIB32942.1 hypothetical protein E3P85_01647 [Wallemia ichthyophaga]TIB46912.1 hypothetical protein E3P82_02012 [Wallemia ichthyophaga]TIB51139.1 hypothetical protein E3P81_02015 [Wallemia ichthyophaga]